LNTNGKGDTRNALLLGALQTSNTLANGTTSYQGAYGQLVSTIGNKTHELDVTSAAAGKLLDSTVATQQSISGVNLDEEATNLLRYQQAYQAAGKVMQTAGQLFDLLLTLGQ
jgi:flagellar hook-associated protein 1 FlgK